MHHKTASNVKLTNKQFSLTFFLLTSLNFKVNFLKYLLTCSNLNIYKKILLSVTHAWLSLHWQTSTECRMRLTAKRSKAKSRQKFREKVSKRKTDGDLLLSWYITVDNADRLRLMWIPSENRWPVVAACFEFSDPAKSTRFYTSNRRSNTQ